MCNKIIILFYIDLNNDVYDEVNDSNKYNASNTNKNSTTSSSAHTFSTSEQIQKFFSTALHLNFNYKLHTNYINRFIHALKRYHPYISMFFYPSIRNTRIIRYFNLINYLLFIALIDTLFYKIIFSNDFCTSFSGI